MTKEVNNNVYLCNTSVFLTPSSWCSICTDFNSTGIDVGHVCNREKILEPLGSGESHGLFFHPEVTK